MTQRQPFPFADDYTEVDEEPFELHESIPPTIGREQPMTMPQRMYALERRQVAQGKDLKAVVAKMDQILKMMSWKQSVKTIGYPVVSVAATAAASHFPQLKPVFDAIMAFFTGQ